MRKLLAYVLVASLSAIVGCNRTTTTDSTSTRTPAQSPTPATLDGSYRLVRMGYEGVYFYEQRPFNVTISGATLIFKDGPWGERGLVCSIKTDPSQNPPTIDIENTEDPQARIDRAIYKLEGDVLTLASIPGSSTRAKDFSLDKGVKIFELKRK